MKVKDILKILEVVGARLFIRLMIPQDTNHTGHGFMKKVPQDGLVKLQNVRCQEESTL